MRYRTGLCALSFIIVLPGLRAQLTVAPMSPAAFCGSAMLNVDFTAAGTYNAGNVFTVQLSDAVGSFAAPTEIGGLAGIGAGTIPCTLPVGVGGGHAVRVVASDPAEVGEAYVLPILTMVPANAGINASVAVCNNGPSFNMWAQLGGSPVAGGMWTGPAGDFQSGVFDPAISPAGCHAYTVAGLPPCANETAVLCIQVHPAPDAGLSNAITWCTSWGPFNMIDQLAGTPMPGGTWAHTTGPHSPVFDPATDPPGEYAYTVPGMSPCADATAILTVTLTAVCVTGPQTPYPVE